MNKLGNPIYSIFRLQLFNEQLFMRHNCTIGWVDIGTVEKVPQKLVVHLKKVGKMTQKFV
jgi:hypothetical protein